MSCNAIGLALGKFDSFEAVNLLLEGLQKCYSHALENLEVVEAASGQKTAHISHACRDGIGNYERWRADLLATDGYAGAFSLTLSSFPHLALYTPAHAEALLCRHKCHP